MKRFQATILSSAAVIVFSAAPVPAQDNQVYIEQQGSANTLFIDQSEASGSTVRGLEMTSGGSVTEPQPYSVDVVATDEDGQPIEVDGVLQMTTETRYRDVTARVVGFNDADRALQDGVGNSASITMTGNGGTARLLQDGNGNVGTLNVGAGGLGALGQQGAGNQASLTVGTESSGTILQDGDDNEGSLNVEDGSGFLSQLGSNNTAQFTVLNGQNVTYIQDGSNLSAINPGTGVTVDTNSAGGVTIIQSVIGGN